MHIKFLVLIIVNFILTTCSPTEIFANQALPVTINSPTLETSSGYSYYHTPRITITETGVGSLKKGEEVRVSVLTEKPEDMSYFRTVYSLAYIEVINSNLKISNIKVMSGSNDTQPFLSFTIESESTNIPAILHEGSKSIFL